MKAEEIKEKAKELGIKVSRMKKDDLIKAIQKAEGNYECFGTAIDDCDQLNCCWKDDCLKG
jgi:hypothetical protein